MHVRARMQVLRPTMRANERGAGADSLLTAGVRHVLARSPCRRRACRVGTGRHGCRIASSAVHARVRKPALRAAIAVDGGTFRLSCRR